MHSLAVPVPWFCTISTGVTRSYSSHGTLPKRLPQQLHVQLKRMEKETGKRFGDPSRPLLVSVRSGAEVSMPGMMDTVLNLGMNPEVVDGLAKATNPEFAWNCYHRFLSMFGSVVFELDLPKQEGLPTELACKELREWIGAKIGGTFPDDPMTQLSMAILAVLRSWNSERAKLYRSEHGIPDWLGTAVNIQAMVFGNLGEDSATGVVFSRNVSNGDKGIYGEFLISAQGEDIVAGIRTPRPIAEMRVWNEALYTQLEKTVELLEEKLRDAVDVEFTVERGKLYILQVRAAKRTPEAAVTIATHMVWEERWTKDEALLRARKHARSLTLDGFDPEELATAKVVATGLPASPGAVSGIVAFDSKRAVALQNEGHDVILLRSETSPNDLEGMIAAKAVVTANGGLTSHAAVVARGMGRPAVVGAKGISIFDDFADYGAGGKIYEGSYLSVDGSTGKIYVGEVARTKIATLRKEINIFLKWMKASEPPAPTPRIDFSHFRRRVSENLLLNDFYMAEAMYHESIGTAFEDEALEHKMAVHVKVAEILACYLAVAVAGELRHAWEHVEDADGDDFEIPSAGNFAEGCTCDSCKMHKTKYDIAVAAQKILGLNKMDDVFDPGDDSPEAARGYLQKKFKINRSSSRSTVQEEAVKKMSECSMEELIVFFQKAEKVFAGFKWGSGYGGPAWAHIAAVPVKFLTGKIPHSIFADHVFDLQHNGGSVFGKHYMLNGDRDKIQNQLEKKKHSTHVLALKDKMRYYYDVYSESTMKILEKGTKLGIWKGSTPTGKAVYREQQVAHI